MTNLLARVWDLPPRETLRKAKRILQGKRGTLDLEEILSTPRLMRSQRFYDFFSRYEAILERAHKWQKIDFEGKNVLEIGCGPQLGFGPLALFRGAESFTAMDPGYDPEVLQSKLMLNSYFLQLYKDLSAVYGERLGFVDFIDTLRSRTNVTADTLVGTKLEGPFDVVLSNSCLEHVFDFDKSMKVLYGLCAQDCRFIHLVDFSNHRGTFNPFLGLYSVSHDQYLSKYDDAINLLRASDILKGMEAAGFGVEMTKYASFPEFYEGGIHSYWSDRYTEEELFLKTAIFHSVASV